MGASLRTTREKGPYKGQGSPIEKYTANREKSHNENGPNLTENKTAIYLISGYPVPQNVLTSEH